ncbi:NAD-dependent succinate-semialdehyde dehydrogenase [Rhizobium wuzhouense]|uniref:NAD-dependent succinate-semialdehyde dehydrogenase n=1 Tax=Rhizobium wuzhouense TaxID=1986026 RepID=A0ABX5NP46_9HYPH|nr:NAD-dependent succinate-semialdehyde dehydrogenase [Rhizobium wuzhouense]PYB72294.1 NAD-dependent succinate-semialdehyde dehydrogenase [Rhizobium wuzhouense]
MKTDSKYPRLRLFIAGRWIDGAMGDGTEVLDPARGDVIGVMPHASKSQLDEALDSAESAFRAWRSVSPYDRAMILLRAAALIRARAEDLAWLITTELGKPLAEARLEVETAASIFAWDAEEGRRAYGRVIPSRQPGVRQIVVREPVGPIAAFAPWNAPLITPSRKISGALAAGCSVVIKPAEETPACTLALAAILEEAGLPAGTLNVVTGNPAEISKYLISSPLIKGVTFTGSTAVGKALAAEAALGMKRMISELGGHAPVLIFPEIDVEALAVSAAKAKFRNAGQVCTSPTRFFVHESIHARFAEAFAEAAGRIQVGDGRDPTTQMGPLAHARRLSSIEEFVDDARDRGIAVATGGGRIGNRGFFFQPTLLADAGDDSLAMNVEPFGPLAVTQPFGSTQEAIRLANRLPFGLAAYAFTHDSRISAQVAEEVESGNVIINHWQASLPETPFGGLKDSGQGREGGIEGLEAFQTVKYVSQA